MKTAFRETSRRTGETRNFCENCSTETQLRFLMEDQARLELSEFRRWRLTRNWLIWGFVPGVLLASNLVGWITHFRYSFFIVVAIWVIFITYVTGGVQRWPCPQCGSRL
jgi:hypothetical protein